MVGQVADDNYPQLDLDAQICLPLYTASRAVTRRYGELLHDVGLTYTQYLVMLALWGRRTWTVGELGDRLHLDSGTLTPVLKRMQAADLLTRRRDPDDERRVIVELTKRGQALRHRVALIPLELGRSLKLSEPEFRQLRELLAKIVDSVSPRAGRPSR